MQVLIDFFLGLADGIISLFEWLISTLKDLAYIAKLLVSFIADIPSYFSWLPAEVVGIIVAIFGIVAIYKICGRE